MGNRPRSLVFVSVCSAPKEAMELEARIKVNPDDVAARVDPKCVGADSAGEIKGSEITPAQQEAMPAGSRNGAAFGLAVTAHDVPTSVDPTRVATGVASAGKIDRSEYAVAQEKVMG